MPQLRSLALVGALLMSASPHLQQGQGANAASSDAMNMLRSGPLTRSPGETNELLSAAPATFPKGLLPVGGVVVAASQSASMTVVVTAIRSGAPFDPIRFQWMLQDSGWVSATPIRTGFVQPDSMSQTQLITVCKGTDFMTWISRALPTGDHLVRESWGKDPQRSCAPVGMRPMTDVPIPELAPPRGVSLGRTGGGGGLDVQESHARLDTTMTIDALQRHFLAQMTAAGWKVESGPTSDGVMSVTRLSVASKAGDPITGQLLMTALKGTTSVEAELRVIRNKPAGR